jgi:hypothetical protein
MIFKLDDDEVKRADAFIKACEAEKATTPTAIGGRFAYTFVDTSIGRMAFIEDSETGKELLLSQNL